MTIAQIADVTLPPADHKAKLKYSKGRISNIMREVFDCYKQKRDQAKYLAPYLEGRSLLETCNNVWDFIKLHINYKEDPDGVQWIREPRRLWSDKEGDCKSFAVMASSLLYNLGINFYFRFVSFKKNSVIPTHVYIVVPGKDGNEIIIDPVVEYFNYQAPFVYKHDYAMTAISRLSGVPKRVGCVSQISGQGPLGIGSIGCACDEKVGSGFLADTFAAGSRTAELLKKIKEIAPAFLYIYLNTDDPVIASKVPAIVKQKNYKAGQTGFDFGAQGNFDSAKVFFPALRDALTEQLGMSPEAFWSKVLNYPITRFGIAGPAIGLFDWNDPVVAPPAPKTSKASTIFNAASSAISSNNGNLAAAGISAGLNLLLPGAGQFATGLLSSLFPGLQYKYSLESFAPTREDWAGWPVSPFPTESAGQNSTGNNGSNDSTKSSVSPWLLGVLALGGLFAISKMKKKKQ